MAEAQGPLRETLLGRKVLMSTHIKDATYYANPDVTVEGGGKQIYSRELKKNVTVDNSSTNSSTANGNN